MLSKDLPEAIERLTNAVALLTQAAHEIHWAANDINSSRDPIALEIRPGTRRESAALEYAARTILPHRIAPVMDDLEAAYDLISSLKNAVRPLDSCEPYAPSDKLS